MHLSESQQVESLVDAITGQSPAKSMGRHLTVSSTAAILPHCTATAISCTVWLYHSGSLVCILKSSKKAAASGPKTPLVSGVIGMKWCLTCSSVYLLLSCCSTWAATKPASPNASLTCEGAKVLVRACHIPQQHPATPEACHLSGISPHGHQLSHMLIDAFFFDESIDACQGWQLRPWVPRLCVTHDLSLVYRVVIVSVSTYSCI